MKNSYVNINEYKVKCLKIFLYIWVKIREKFKIPHTMQISLMFKNMKYTVVNI